MKTGIDSLSLLRLAVSLITIPKSKFDSKIHEYDSELMSILIQAGLVEFMIACGVYQVYGCPRGKYIDLMCSCKNGIRFLFGF